MKRWMRGLFTAVVMVIAAGVGSVCAQGPDDPVIFKAGPYTPTGDLDKLDTGFSGDITFGHIFDPNLAIEGSLGYFGTDGTVNDKVSPGLGVYSENDTYDVFTFLLTLKGFVTLQRVELYGGGGIGAYFTQFKININSPSAGFLRVDDEDVVFGGHLLAGVNVAITPGWFVGVEGKYVITGNVSPSDSHLPNEPELLENNLNGFMITGNIGFRF
jgi:opacity protein-like surface antigen